MKQSENTRERTDNAMDDASEDSEVIHLRNASADSEVRDGPIRRRVYHHRR